MTSLIGSKTSSDCSVRNLCIFVFLLPILSTFSCSGTKPLSRIKNPPSGDNPELGKVQKRAAQTIKVVEHLPY